MAFGRENAAAGWVDHVCCAANTVADQHWPAASHSLINTQTPRFTRGRQNEKIAQPVNDRHTALILERQNAKALRTGRCKSIDLLLEFPATDQDQNTAWIMQLKDRLHELDRTLVLLKFPGKQEHTT